MKRILVIGDSTIQWMRPYRNHTTERTYVELILQKYDLDIISKPGMTSKDTLQYIWNNLGGSFYDLYIISVGINDLTPRTYPRWLWKINNNILVSNSYSEKFFKFIYQILTYSKLQTLCSKLNISIPWVSAHAFKLNLFKLQEIILKESDSKIIFLSLPMVSQRVKNMLPGIERNVIEYKKVLSKLSCERSMTLDIDIIFQNNMDLYNPEGIHYSAEGHKKVFEALVEIIEMKNI